MSSKKARNNGKGALVNRPCPCGSFKKYKNCCKLKDEGYNPDGTCAHPESKRRILIVKGGQVVFCGQCRMVLGQIKPSKQSKVRQAKVASVGEQGYRHEHA